MEASLKLPSAMDSSFLVGGLKPDGGGLNFGYHEDNFLGACFFGFLSLPSLVESEVPLEAYSSKSMPSLAI